jgi:hypothetical protein
MLPDAAVHSSVSAHDPSYRFYQEMIRFAALVVRDESSRVESCGTGHTNVRLPDGSHSTSHLFKKIEDYDGEPAYRTE